MLLFQTYTSVQFHIASKCTTLSHFKWDRNLFMKKTLSWSQKCLIYGKNSGIMHLFSIEIVYLFPEVTVDVDKWIFCSKEGISMETDPFPANLCQILNILL